jgi:hypothetical protein
MPLPTTTGTLDLAEELHLPCDPEPPRPAGDEIKAA